ncbi:hypothetical protein [Rickettsiella endosymbiont of Dermanyssus gallinae]|uniref:hypothetical protein n=1 Tax=Rickettsiella endosymbiont of Dermanyssus gallinae TaxID=2856608 RepID=UPI001C52B07E|nr:hypothetical protein [Rickettsiella endosymbiont of Dermanyssus gallinae]
MSLLNDPNYKPLKELLFSKQTSLLREDLFSVSNNVDPFSVASARYQQSLYSAFGITKNDKNSSADQLDSVMTELVYKP